MGYLKANFNHPSELERMVLYSLRFALLVGMLIVVLGGVLSQGQVTSDQSDITFQASAKLVIIDVSVRDARGLPVPDLGAEDFSVFENGRRQNIQFFDKHVFKGLKQLQVTPTLPTNSFTNSPPSSSESPYTIVLFDALNTSLEDWSFAEEEIHKYLTSAQPDGRTAIFVLTSRLRMICGFSADSQAFHRTLLQRDLKELWNDFRGTPFLHESPFPSEHDAGSIDSRFDGVRTDYTIQALSELGRFLDGIRGRKNLIWISGSFPLVHNVFVTDSEGLTYSTPISGESRSLVNVFARNRIAIYPIDVRGLLVGPTIDASDQCLPDSGLHTGTEGACLTKKGPIETFYRDYLREREELNNLAASTGGEAFISTNGIHQAIDQVVQSGSNYYSLAYVPLDLKDDHTFRRVQVSVDRPGVALKYRLGYYSASQIERETNKPYFSAPAREHTAMDQIAMLNAPWPTSVLFQARLTLLSDKAARVAQGNRATTTMAGPYRLFSVDYTLNPNQIVCNFERGKTHVCILDSEIFVYDLYGKLLNLCTDRTKISIPGPLWDSVQNNRGIQFQRNISVPTKGDYRLRIGVQDVLSDKVGALEISTLDLKSN